MAKRKYFILEGNDGYHIATLSVTDNKSIIKKLKMALKDEFGDGAKAKWN